MSFSRPTILGLLALLIGLSPVLACRKPQGTILGKAPRGETSTVLAVKAGDTPPDVVLSGTIIEKCPVAGCWFRLRDRTGTIKVDTKAAGFVVVKVPLDRKVTVAGKIVPEGDGSIIQATGLRY